MFTPSHYEPVERTTFKSEILLLETFNNETFITHFDVGTNNQPINSRVVDPKQIIEKLSTEKCSNKLIDSRILVDTPHQLVWHYTPPENQKLFYRYNKNVINHPIKWCNFIFKNKAML